MQYSCVPGSDDLNAPVYEIGWNLATSRSAVILNGVFNVAFDGGCGAASPPSHGQFAAKQSQAYRTPSYLIELPKMEGV